MVKYRRPKSENMIDIRTGRGSPDDRQEQIYNRNRHENIAYRDQLRSMVNGTPLPRPDPRREMPGGELAIGKGQSRQDFWTALKEASWVQTTADELSTTHYRDKFLWVFPMSPGEKLSGGLVGTYKEKGNVEASQFLLDTFKRARTSGFKISPINEQPAPLPLTFKAKQ